MLHEYLNENRGWLLGRCRALREARNQLPSDAQTEQGLATFLEQLVESLRMEQAHGASTSAAISGPSSSAPAQSDIGIAEAAQGGQMQAKGFSIDDVVHSYGDMCHCIADLAIERDLRLSLPEYRLLNHCLDNAMANAVAEYSFRRDMALAGERRRDQNRKLNSLGEELRKHLGTATLAISALKARELTLGGVTGTILERSLLSLGKMIEALPDTDDNGADLLELVPLASLMEQVQQTLAPAALVLDCKIALATIDPTLALKGSRETIQSAIVGLLQNALNQPCHGETIALHGYARGDHIFIDTVLPHRPDAPQENTPPVLIARQLLAGSHGSLLVRDNPNSPYTLSISLPRWTLPS